MHRLLKAAALIAMCGIVPAACQQYQNYPPIESARGIPESPNKPATASVMTLALQYAATRYPPGGPTYEATNARDAGKLTTDEAIAVNLPLGTRKVFYDKTVSRIGPNVQGVTPEIVQAGQLPIYHVSRVWMRFSRAEVDVMRPMPELGLAPDGKPVYQKITVRLEGGFEPWRVVHARAWAPGAESPPEFFFVPETDRIDEWDIAKRARNSPGAVVGG